MKTITLKFSAVSSVSSAVIEWFSASVRGFSHVDAVMGDGSLLGSQSPDGVRIRPQGYARFIRTIDIPIAVSDEQWLDFWHWLQDQVGKPYDNTAIIAFMINRDWQEDDSWMCSELMTAALQHCKFFEFPLQPAANKITPADLLLLLSAHQDISKIPELSKTMHPK